RADLRAAVPAGAHGGRRGSDLVWYPGDHCDSDQLSDTAHGLFDLLSIVDCATGHEIRPGLQGGGAVHPGPVPDPGAGGAVPGPGDLAAAARRGFLMLIPGPCAPSWPGMPGRLSRV